jgi:hypothetical protein
MTIAKTTKKQSKPGFKPGKSGNPQGRPQGSRNRATLALEALLEGEGEAITRKAVDMALQGEMAAIRLCLERLVPVRKDAPVPFDMPSMTNANDSAAAMSGVLQALANGDITPGEASSVAGVIETYRRTLETTEIEERISALEKEKSN